MATMRYYRDFYAGRADPDALDVFELLALERVAAGEGVAELDEESLGRLFVAVAKRTGVTIAEQLRTGFARWSELVELGETAGLQAAAV